jgi:hypothetical protein
MAYDSCYMASLGCIAATSLRMKEYEEIQRHTNTPENGDTSEDIAKGRICNKQIRGAGIGTFGGGPGLRAITVPVGTLMEWRYPGSLYRMLMEFTQLECGMEQEILS